MSDSHLFSLRPYVRPAGTPTLEGAFRVHVAPKELKALGLEAGDLCSLNISDSTAGLGFIWPSYDNNAVTPKRIAKISDVLKDTYGLNYQDKVTISKVDDGLQRADTVYVTEVGDRCLGQKDLELEEIQFWASNYLSRYEAVVPGGTFDITPRRGQQKPQKRRFLVERVEPGNATAETPYTLSYFDFKSKVAISESYPTPSSPKQRSHDFHITAERIGGLQKELEQLNKRLAAFNGNSKRMLLPLQMRRHGAILLHGLEGTGKSLLLQKLAQIPWCAVVNVDESVIGQYVGQSQASLRKLFTRAISNQPSLVIIDKVESLAGKHDAEKQGVAINLAPALAAELEKARDHEVMVVATTNRPNDIDKTLRTPSRFRYEIELPIPDVYARTEILKIHLDKDKASPDQLCETIGERTHGFVGSDLEALCGAALERAVDRYMNVEEPNGAFEDKQKPSEAEEKALEIENSNVEVLLGDFEAALLEIRPTAMREVFFETPKVKWADIGGSEDVKKALYKVVERPFKHPQIMSDLDLEPQKGILLYGPPGCSKTLTAKAVATEAGLNFIAIKGAELISMYVGESERAIREVFRKARAAAPSIIFFDEIDAIASTRGNHSSSSSSSTSGTPGLNVLTTLLNEMDGIEYLRGVLVLAATNKPDILDPALMRPGRFDSLLYIGLPGLAARVQIINTRTRKMPLADDVDVEALASRMGAYSGAEIVRICVEAAEATAEEREAGDVGAKVSKRHFELALEKIVRQITPEQMKTFERFRSGH